MAWQNDLQPASWRGMPFFVEVGEFTAGRGTAVQVYPFRETSPVWVEDLGLAPTANRIIGFLIGEDVAGQQQSMVSAMRAPGPGVLVHPMRGQLVGSVVGGCRFLMRKDRGRYIELAFEFVEFDAQAPYPAQAPSQAGPRTSDAAPDSPEAVDEERQRYFASRLDSVDRSIAFQQQVGQELAAGGAVPTASAAAITPPDTANLPQYASAGSDQATIERSRDVRYAARIDNVQQSVAYQRQLAARGL